jgi:two-component system, OmpR family, KDP operon response regulator KdpE
MTPDSPSTRPAVERKRVLVVDDEPEFLRAVALRLKSAGYDVLSACDGVQATHMAVAEQPDVIVLDLGLPGGDGHTVAGRLRSNMKTLNMPVIFLTARAGAMDKKKALAVGAAGYLTKPYQADELLQMLDRVLHT